MKGTTLDQKFYDKEGRLLRSDSQFRNFIRNDNSTPYNVESGRYHLYINMGCPWANACLIMIRLKGLDDHITINTTRPEWGQITQDGRFGWVFDSNSGLENIPGTDTVLNCHSILDVYQVAQKGYTDKATVPILFDKKTNTIVNNESSEIIKMFNCEFDSLATNKNIDIYPSQLQSKIDEFSKWIYDDINNGVYKCGFAQSQLAYDEAFQKLFDSLDKIEIILENQDYLINNQFTYVDLRLFMTLIRFDSVYVVYFKCNKRSIESYQNLNRYVRNIYHNTFGGLKKYVNIDHIKTHYYTSHPIMNPYKIIPKGPNPWWEIPYKN